MGGPEAVFGLQFRGSRTLVGTQQLMAVSY